MAGRQEGVVSEAQLRRLGLDRFAVARWVRVGRLHRRHPGVYSVGHEAVTEKGELIAALFFAGAGAALSHRTAACWWGLTPPSHGAIHVSVARRKRPVAGIVLHHPRRLERLLHHRLPVTPVPRTLLDFAASASYADVRRAIAEADFRELTTPDELESVTGQGAPGSANLRAALESYLPQLARANGPLEEAFLRLCEREGIPLPAINVRVGGFTVDALWRAERVIVELDGKAAHSSGARRAIDHDRDLALRALGYVVRRYSGAQVFGKPRAVSADLRVLLASRSVGGSSR